MSVSVLLLECWLEAVKYALDKEQNCLNYLRSESLISQMEESEWKWARILKYGAVAKWANEAAKIFSGRTEKKNGEEKKCFSVRLNEMPLRKMDSRV